MYGRRPYHSRVRRRLLLLLPLTQEPERFWVKAKLGLFTHLKVYRRNLNSPYVLPKYIDSEVNRIQQQLLSEADYKRAFEDLYGGRTPLSVLSIGSKDSTAGAAAAAEEDAALPPLEEVD
jgi:hypothetical protein